MKNIATLASFLLLAGCTHRPASRSAAPPPSSSAATGAMGGVDAQNTAGADATTHDTTTPDGTMTATGSAPVSGEKDLLQQLVDGNRMDIDMSRLAKTNAKMASVKAFAQKAINDHGVFADKIKPFAEAQGIDTSSIKGSSDAAVSGAATGMVTRMEHLKTLKGSDFDKEYVSMMIDGHEHLLKVIDDLTGITTDSKLKSTLGPIRVVLKAHLTSAEELQHAIGGPEKQETRGTDDDGTTR